MEQPIDPNSSIPSPSTPAATPPPVPTSASISEKNSFLLPPPPRRKVSRWLKILLGISIFLNIGFFFYYRLLFGNSDNTATPFVEHFLTGEKNSSNKIAVVRVEGLIAREVQGHMGHDGMVGDICEQLRLALDDEAVKAIILRVDSPGGEVLASHEIYRAVKDADHEKPVICSMGSLAASGGYYSAMGARWIIADNLTVTGSIGVIMETLNYKDLFGKIGLKSVVYKSGKYKDILNGSRDSTPEESGIIQSLIMETYDQFVGIVATERKLDLTMLKNNLADGRIFSGKQALAVKLVDQTGNFEDAIIKAKKEANISDAKVSDYAVPFSLRNLLEVFAETRVPRIQLDLPASSQLKLQHGKLYYLSMHLF